ncbi:hypothetical protein [Nannocystis sp.]|uniref:hypothetical protein n=1 Tax=Nannocystis sp. TaxID=1962667 RepID=UPI0025FE17D3|nr:hypothetical protein [Nannocystis sp.]MBK7826147.1 hypothetical protein [Nannocystis sp.]
MTRRSERSRGAAGRPPPVVEGAGMSEGTGWMSEWTGERGMSEGTGCVSARTGGHGMSGGTGDRAGAWAMLAALATGCCAPQPGLSAPPPAVAAGAEVGVGAGPVEDGEFVAIDLAEARRRLWPDPPPRAYLAPDAAQQAAVAALIRGMLAEPSPAPAALAEAARAAGFVVEGWTIAGQRYLAARELAERRGGGGAYLVRAEARASSAVILEAPHGFFDLGTERIALELFVAGRGWPRALFVNTVHRYLGADGVKRRQAESPADPCHSPGHLLAVATAAAVESLPGVEVVQLHGFGDDEAEAGAMPAAIVSGGRAEAATPRSRVVAQRLAQGLGVAVGLFPVDTDRLGATTNVQGRAVQQREGASFVHLEMSAALRQRLRDDPAARAQFADALRVDPPTGRP